MSNNTNAVNTVMDTDFSAMIAKAVTALQNKASATDAAKKALSAVAVACVNRCLFDKQLDRLEAACAAFRAYPNDFAFFVGKVLIFAGGFREDAGKYLDVRKDPDTVPVLKLDAKAGQLRWNLPPKSPAGKAVIAAAAAAWKPIQDKAGDIAFQTPKRDKVITYKDVVDTLKRFQKNDDRWAASDKLAIRALLDKLSSELSD